MGPLHDIDGTDLLVALTCTLCRDNALDSPEALHAVLCRFLEVLPPEMAGQVVARARKSGQDRQEREAKEAQRLSALAVPGEETDDEEDEAQRRPLFEAYLARHHDEIEALRNSRAPVELSRARTAWVVLDAHNSVLGSAESIEDAHTEAVQTMLARLDLEYLLGALDFPPSNDELYWVPTQYIRVQGPAEGVSELAHLELEEAR